MKLHSHELLHGRRTLSNEARLLLYRIGSVLLFAVLVLLLFWLAEAMLHHRFFEGGWVNRNGTIRP